MKTSFTRAGFLGVAISMFLGSCMTIPQTAANGDSLEIVTPDQRGASEGLTEESVISDSAPSDQRIAYVNGDGNHFVAGHSALDISSPLDVQLEFRPVWLLGVEMSQGSAWVAISDSGDVEAFQVIGGTAQALEIEPRSLPSGKPPVVTYDGLTTRLFTSGDQNAATDTYAVYLPRSDRLAYIDQSGDLIVTDGVASEHLELGALPDARLLVDDEDRILLLGRRTERYPHGVLGDGYEAGSILLVTTTPQLQLIQDIQLPEREVFEGNSPIWHDFDGDGIREIFATVSDRDQGAYLAMFSENGSLLARSEAIGRAFRWRHPITVADFLGTGQFEIAAVLTPHIGGILEFFSWEGREFKLLATRGGVSSHRIGSRNLDMALSADVDGDQHIELLLPTSTYDALVAFQRDGDEVVLDWEVQLGSRLSTNLAGVVFEDGELGFGLGLESGIVRLWLPR